MATVRDLWPLYPWLVTGVFFHLFMWPIYLYINLYFCLFAIFILFLPSIPEIIPCYYEEWQTNKFGSVGKAIYWFSYHYHMWCMHASMYDVHISKYKERHLLICSYKMLDYITLSRAYLGCPKVIILNYFKRRCVSYR